MNEDRRLSLPLPKHKPLSATIDFWQRWTNPKEKTNLKIAIENLRRQSRD